MTGGSPVVSEGVGVEASPESSGPTGVVSPGRVGSSVAGLPSESVSVGRSMLTEGSAVVSLPPWGFRQETSRVTDRVSTKSAANSHRVCFLTFICFIMQLPTLSEDRVQKFYGEKNQETGSKDLGHTP